MATGLQNTWSTTPASNATADDNINAAEGQAPSTLNDSIRAVMAAIAKLRGDISGKIVTGGTATAYTITTNEVITALNDGVMVAARLHADLGVAPTLQVDGTAAKPIQTRSGVAAGAGELPAGAVVVFTYSTANVAWMVGGARATYRPFASSAASLPFFNSSVPTGWTKDVTGNDRAIRLVSGSGGGTGGSTAFSSVMASRVISQSNLPNYNFPFNLTTATVVENIIGAGLNQSTQPGQVGGSFTALTNGTSLNLPMNRVGVGVNGTVSMNGGGVGMDFAVTYTDVIRGTIN